MSHRQQRHGARQESAETLALRALGWLATEGDRLAGFLGWSGLSPATLARHAGEPQVMAGVLDHLLADEPLLIDCAADLGVPPTAFAQARALLPGGEAPHWT